MARLWFALLIGCLAPALVLCEEPNSSWDTLVQSLQPGRTVVVTRMTAAQLEGRLLALDAESITVQWRGQPHVVRREDVYRVRIANIRMRNTLIGMAVGFAGGMAAAYAKKGYTSGGEAAFVGLVGTGVGAAVGGAMPRGKPLYQVAGPPQRAARMPARD